MSQAFLAAAAVAATLFTASPRAQLTTTNKVVGLVQSRISITPAQLDIQDIDNRCQAATRLGPSVLPSLTASNGGGTAYDPRHESVWVGNSSVIEEWVPGKTCRKTCSVKTALMDAKAQLTGLAISDHRQMLYALESRGGYVGIRPWILKACPPVPTRGGCAIKLTNSSATAGGIAYDEVRDLVYFTVSFPAFVGFITDLYVAPAANPCKWVKAGLGTCQVGATGWGAVTGLAYDSCSRRLYATDGRLTLSVAMTDPTKLSWKTISCCKKGSIGNYVGLAVAPGWKQSVPTGSAGCTGKGCAFCSSIRQRLTGGAPSLGNPDFGSQVENGPMPGFGILMVGFGPCGRGLSLPFLCKPFYPGLAPAPLAIPGGLLTGKGQCLGSVNIKAGVPVDAKACGLTLCTQWLVLCGTTFSGWGMSQAIEFTVASS